jgi:hypothetical protein
MILEARACITTAGAAAMISFFVSSEGSGHPDMRTTRMWLHHARYRVITIKCSRGRDTHGVSLGRWK